MERCRIKGQFQKDLNGRDLQRQILSVDKARAKYYQFYREQVWWRRKITIYALINRTKVPVKYCVIVISIFPMMALYPFVQEYFVTGVMIGSIKG